MFEYWIGVGQLVAIGLVSFSVSDLWWRPFFPMTRKIVCLRVTIVSAVVLYYQVGCWTFVKGSVFAPWLIGGLRGFGRSIRAFTSCRKDRISRQSDIKANCRVQKGGSTFVNCHQLKYVRYSLKIGRIPFSCSNIWADCVLASSPSSWTFN